MMANAGNMRGNWVGTTQPMGNPHSPKTNPVGGKKSPHMTKTTKSKAGRGGKRK